VCARSSTTKKRSYDTFQYRAHIQDVFAIIERPAAAQSRKQMNSKSFDQIRKAMRNQIRGLCRTDLTTSYWNDGKEGVYQTASIIIYVIGRLSYSERVWKNGSISGERIELDNSMNPLGDYIILGVCAASDTASIKSVYMAHEIDHENISENLFPGVRRPTIGYIDLLCSSFGFGSIAMQLMEKIYIKMGYHGMCLSSVDTAYSFYPCKFGYRLHDINTNKTYKFKYDKQGKLIPYQLFSGDKSSSGYFMIKSFLKSSSVNVACEKSKKIQNGHNINTTSES